MKTVEIDFEKGIVIRGGNISIIDGVDACRQDAICRVRLVLGEDFYDQTLGIPWFDESMAKNEPREVTRSRIRDELMRSDEVLSVQRIDFNYEKGEANLSARLSSIYGDFEL